MKKKALYVVLMRKFGQYDTHAYVLGVFDKKYSAMQAGAAEEAWRHYENTN